VEKAREILDQAVENVQLSKPLLEVCLSFSSKGINCGGIGVSY